MPVPTATASWHRLIRFLACEDNTVHLGEPVDPDLDVGAAFAEGNRVEAWVLDAEVPWDPRAVRTGEVRTVRELLSPVSAEMCGPIRATGLSYKDHAAELNLPHPLHPVLFFKPPTTLASPSEPIPIPPICQDSQMDYEVELALVLSRETRDVRPQDALDHVLGWTVANDLTARKWQGKCSQWGFCKGFDKFCPLGPCLVSPRLIPDPSVLALTTHLNATSMQSGSARKMIFSIPQIISFLSQGTTLPAGTVIITGTPPGIGDGRSPKVWLKDGDEVRCWISHGVGTLVNRIVYE
ncbi:hypothetical protein EHS25_004047 [Saitozyma podzolica]|uniref:Fumarylacetoacetase-like C-terminal domain-containing protein n=1 Tax=Saitozyma podzolica TaxID=1890683 RepID=A0A427YSY5_9TREE|nr:hypothetical protein EHS25_004047 [Saitozyma podzolica]